MANTPTISLDLSNLHADAVGEHGLTTTELDGIETRVAEISERITSERKDGRHAYLDLVHDSQMLESILRVTQPRLGRYKHLVLLGIGGSSLGLKALVQALPPNGPDLHVVDNTDPTVFAAVREAITVRDTLFVPVSKSGGTLETVAALGYFVGELRKQGLELADHILAVTDPETGYLRAFADKHDITTADIPPGVGGRFSVLSAAGLVPAALMNIDVAALLQGAANATTIGWAARLGLGAATLCMKHGKSGLVFMPYSSRLKYVSDWFIQLWDESLGKDGKGQTAVPAVGATDQHAQAQLFLEGPNNNLLLFTRLGKHSGDIKLGEFEWEEFGAPYLQGKSLGEIINAQYAGTAQACTERSRPNATINLPTLDASTLGELLMGLQIATTYAGFALDVNPYDQPGVELGKRISRKMLGG